MRGEVEMNWRCTDGKKRGGWQQLLHCFGTTSIVHVSLSKCGIGGCWTSTCIPKAATSLNLAGNPLFGQIYPGKADGKSFQVVYISMDKNVTTGQEDAAQFDEAFSQNMPWLAVPYEDKSRRDQLAAAFRVSFF